MEFRRTSIAGVAAVLSFPKAPDDTPNLVAETGTPRIGGPFTLVGLGIGVPTTGIAGCALSTAINTTPGSSPQLTATVDAGSYCVTIYDIGTLTGPIDFSFTVVFP